MPGSGTSLCLFGRGWPRVLHVLGVVVCASLSSAHAAYSGQVSYEDTARYLAGLPPSPQSPFAKLSHAPAWQQYAAFLSWQWGIFDRIRVRGVRSLAAKEVAQGQTVVMYMFSGPDFVYPNAIFPFATTYVLNGLEGVGDLPNIGDLAASDGAAYLERLKFSLSGFLRLGYFKTSDMHGNESFVGIVPILAVLVVRTGHVLDGIEKISLSKNGDVGARGDSDTDSPGVMMRFHDASGTSKSLYYFYADLSDPIISGTGILAFYKHLGSADSLIKNDSYLLHSAEFSIARDFILGNARMVVQDDSGIPYRYFTPAHWAVRIFGVYRAPLGQFAKFYQADLDAAAKRRPVQRGGFRIGYPRLTPDSHLLIAVRKGEG